MTGVTKNTRQIKLVLVAASMLAGVQQAVVQQCLCSDAQALKVRPLALAVHEVHQAGRGGEGCQGKKILRVV